MTTGSWDFDIERVDLSGLSIDAQRELGMVIVQPEYALDPDSIVPFRIKVPYREDQKNLIEKAFRIRETERRLRSIPVPFVLFPEGSIPVNSPDGLDCLRVQMEHAADEVILIGGLEGLSPEEASRVIEQYAPGINIADIYSAEGDFVNLCVIVVKFNDGHINWYFQAKLAPSQWEQPRSMGRGKRVLYFVKPGLAFLCQICFDLIAAHGSHGTDSLSQALCKKIVLDAQPLAAPLNFVFVPQYNPNVDSFKEYAGYLLCIVHPQFSNACASILAVNRASDIQESPKYGRSGFHYRKGRWQIPIADRGPVGYELYDLDTIGITSAVLRKRTPAIHVATFIPPMHNAGVSTNPHYPLKNPRSYLINDGCDSTPCSCLLGASTDTDRFVACRCLPCKLRDTITVALPTSDAKNRWRGSDGNLSNLCNANYTEMRSNLLGLGYERACDVIDLLLFRHPSPKVNPDLWTDAEKEAAKELLAALSVLAVLRPVIFDTGKQWTAVLNTSLPVVLLDGRGSDYWANLVENYWQGFEGEYNQPAARSRPVLMVALRSRGDVEQLVRKWIPKDITKSKDPDRLDDKDSIDKPVLPQFYVCKSGFLEEARNKNEGEIETFLREKMSEVLS